MTRPAIRLPRKSDAQRTRALEIHDALVARHPDARCELDYRTPHELLVATILSAQATDVGVNKATPGLFKAFPTPEALAEAGPEGIEPHLRSLNFFRNKARAVAESMAAIVERHGGEVPRTMEALLELRGVARKTANVVLGNAFGIDVGVVVDTHVARLSKRFGLTRHDEPAKIERDLMALFPQARWTMLSHLLIFHGRRVCKARGGLCAEDEICRRFCREARPSKRATGGVPSPGPASRATRNPTTKPSPKAKERAKAAATSRTGARTKAPRKTARTSPRRGSAARGSGSG